jgi:beta-lactamase regulating signal transducer with metallopeptidase domain/formylglycine-generating enzyme required for sulfatase activity
MIAYIIKSSLSLILMFGLYWVFLRKEKLFRFNRFLLIFSILISLVIPFISVPVNIQNNEVQKNIVTVLNYDIPAAAKVIAPIPDQNSGIENTIQPIAVKITPAVVKSPGISFTQMLIILYFSGVVILLFRFLRNILFISHQKRLSENIHYSGQRLVLVDSQVNPYCFLNSIYVSKQDYLENRINKELLNHEVQHIKQAHTIDIIFMELIQIFYWFNPIIILYNNAARVNHEYLADNAVLNDSITVKYYADILLNFISCRRNIPLTSGFNQSLTRKRLNMMTKPKSKRVFYGLRISMTIFLILIVSLFLSFRQLNSKNSGMAYILYPVYDTIKIMESGVIHRYTTYSEGFYLSHEITNKEYREFTDWMKINPNESIYLINDTSTFVKNPKTGKTREMIFHLPKRIDVSEIMNEFIVSKAPYSPDSNHQNYFTDERYDDYPVLGVSRRMAEYYCSWKIKSETIITYDTIGGNSAMSMSNENTYRLPTEKEWDFVAQHYAKKEAPNLAKKEIQKSDETGSIETGISHLDDNVSEWVTYDEGKKCIAKGGSWKRGSSISLRQVYDKDNEDETIGFRIVKSPRPKVTSGSNSFDRQNVFTESTVAGVKQELLDEYQNIVNKYRTIKGKQQSFNLNLTPSDKAKLEEIFLQMSKKQQSSQVFVFVPSSTRLIKKTIPSKEQIESFKDSKIYGVWIDEMKVKNEVLNNYTNPDFSSVFVSKLMPNAANGIYDYQVNLMTNQYFQDYNNQTMAKKGNTLTFNPKKINSTLVNSDEKVPEKPLTSKNSPSVVAVFADKSQGSVPKNVALKAYSLETKVLNPDSDEKYEITGFTLLYTKDHVDTELKAKGKELTDEMKSYIANMPRGQKAIFKDIKSLGSDGNLKELPPLIIQVE